MTLASLKRYFDLASLIKVSGGLAGVAVIGTAFWMQRGPDLTFLPQLAEAAVVLPDGRSLYVQKFEVSVAEWNTCFAEGGCELKLKTPSGREPTQLPATGLSYVDVSQYLTWINKRVDHPFRLPTVEEWDFMAREVVHKTPAPLFSDPSLTWASAYIVEAAAPRGLRPSGSFATSAEGIVDLNGSVWEWTQDCYAGNQEIADLSRCPAFFVGGEHVAAIPFQVRDPARGGCAVGSPPAHLGLRMVTDRAPPVSG